MAAADRAAKTNAPICPGAFLGITSDGQWLVRFTIGARHDVYFQIGG